MLVFPCQFLLALKMMQKLRAKSNGKATNSRMHLLAPLPTFFPFSGHQITSDVTDPANVPLSHFHGVIPCPSSQYQWDPLPYWGMEEAFGGPSFNVSIDTENCDPKKSLERMKKGRERSGHRTYAEAPNCREVKPLSYCEESRPAQEKIKFHST